MVDIMTMDDGYMRAREAYSRGDHKQELTEYTKLSQKNPGSAFFMQMVGAANAHLSRENTECNSYVKALNEKVEPYYIRAISLDPNDPEPQYSLIELRLTRGEFEQTFVEAKRLLPIWQKKYNRLWTNSLAFLGVESGILAGKSQGEFAEMMRITESESFCSENVVTCLGWDSRDIELLLSRWCYDEELLPQKQWPRIGKALRLFRRFTNQESKDTI